MGKSEVEAFLTMLANERVSFGPEGQMTTIAVWKIISGVKVGAPAVPAHRGR